MSASRVIVALVVSVIMVLGAVLTVGLAPLGGTVGPEASTTTTLPTATPAAPAPTVTTPVTTAPTAACSSSSPPSSYPFLTVNGDRLVNGVVEPGGHLPACVKDNETNPAHKGPVHHAPAPSGVSYDGQNDTNGVLRDHTIDSNSVAGIQTVNSTSTLFPDSLTPKRWGDQLNVILANVTILGVRGYFFWVQSLAEYDTSNNTLSFYDATWNFTAPGSHMLASSLVSWSNNSSDYINIWLLAHTPYIHCPTPFTLTLYVNSSVTAAGDQELWYNYSLLTNGHFDANGNYDFLIFRSQAPGALQTLAPASFEASATQRKRVNEGYEFDTMIGPDTSSNQINFIANETVQVKYCSLPPSNDCTPTNFAYANVPAAVNYGSQTAEGSIGLSINFVGETAYASAGPFIEHGLWNYSGQTGVEPGYTPVINNISVSGSPVALSAQPYIFAFFESTSYTSQGYQWGADVPVWYLMPGTYNYELMLADYQEQIGTITVGSSPVRLTAVLPYSTASGVYTPLWALNNAQVAGISQSGAGTVSSQYVLFNNPTTATCTFCGGVTSANNLSSMFYLAKNRYTSYAGIILSGTNVYIDVNAPPSFCVNTSGTACNDYLSIWFYNTSHVTLSHGTAIRGWPSPEWTFYMHVPGSQNMFPQGDVVVLSSTHDLIMSNNFVAVADRGGSPDSLVLAGGSGNVVWGNTFRDPPGAALGGAIYGGIGEDEGGDLIYNNNFSVDNPVVWLPFNMSNDAECLPQCTGTPGSSFFYNTGLNTWNITPRPASDVRMVNGFALSGNILGPSVTTQGGNYYWNYGTSPNNYSAIPYVSRFLYTDLSNIYPLGCPKIQAVGQPCGTPPAIVGGYEDGMQNGSGDYAPYGPTVTFTETGLPSGTSWTVTINGTAYATTHSSISIPEPYGLWNYTVSTSASGYDVTPASGSVFASGAPTVRVTFAALQVSVTASPSSALSASALVTFTVAVTLPSGPSPSGTATLYIATASGAVQGTYAVYVTSGLGSKLLIPGLLLPHGSSTLSYWATFSGQSSPSGTLSFSTAAPTTLTLTVSPSSASAGQLVTFTVGSNGHGVAVILSAYSPSGVLLGTYSVGLSATGTGSIVLLPGLLAPTTVWQVSYGTVTSNSVTVGS